MTSRFAALFSLALCVLLAGCQNASDMTKVMRDGPSSDSMTASSTDSAAGITMQWKNTVVVGDYDIPDTTVRLELGGAMQQTVELGTYKGVNDTGDSRTTDLPGAITARRLWWAGAGDNFAVYREGDVLVIKHQAVGETPPDVQYKEPPWETLKEIPLPSGVSLTVVDNRSE